jgi:hypothetical protein
LTKAVSLLVKELKGLIVMASKVRFSLILCAFLSLLSPLTTEAPPCQQSHNAADPMLESSLRSLFSSTFGFVLIDAKPVATTSYVNDFIEASPEAKERLFEFLESSFKNSPTFIFRLSRFEETNFLMELINKQALAKVIRDDQKLQLFIVDKFSSIPKFFEKLASSGEPFFDLFDRNYYCISLALGYGKTNAEYYCQRSNVGHFLKKYPVVKMVPFISKPTPRHVMPHSGRLFFLDEIFHLDAAPKLEKQFRSLEEEWQWIQDVSWNLPDSHEIKPPLYISLPSYVCRHGGDSEKVREKYVKACDCLASLLYKQTFTDAVIEKVS